MVIRVILEYRWFNTGVISTSFQSGPDQDRADFNKVLIYSTEAVIPSFACLIEGFLPFDGHFYLSSSCDSGV